MFPLFHHLFVMKWWDQMLWSSFIECWGLSQLFHSPLSLSSKGSSSFFAFCHKSGVICISEVIDISPSNLDSSLWKFSKFKDNYYYNVFWKLEEIGALICWWIINRYDQGWHQHFKKIFTYLAGSGFSCSTQAFHCGTQAPEYAGSVAASHKLSCPTVYGIWVPRPGIEPRPLHCKVGS